MSKQSDQFLQHEGDAWFRRNKEHLTEISRNSTDDPVIMLLQQFDRPSASVLEIGCSNGWRLDWIHRQWGSRCQGLEPSSQAIKAGRKSYPGLMLHKGTADRLPLPDAAVDLLIFGFCLYLCDRNDLFRIAAEADRVLAPGGQIIIYDFDPTDGVDKTAYRHLEGVYAYRFDHTRLFTWHPHYTLVGGFAGPHPGLSDWSPQSRISVSLLRKSGEDRDHVAFSADLR